MLTMRPVMRPEHYRVLLRDPQSLNLFWFSAHLNGYTYREGTIFFLFGLSVDYQL